MGITIADRLRIYAQDLQNMGVPEDVTASMMEAEDCLEAITPTPLAQLVARAAIRDEVLEDIENDLIATSVIIDNLEDENAALKEQLAGKWLPIETAPKDGTFMLVIWNLKAKISYWHGGMFWGTQPVRMSGQPTRWQPLPPVLKGE